MSKQNRTIKIEPQDSVLLNNTLRLNATVLPKQLENKIIHQDIFEALPFLPEKFVDLLIIDPPYNLTKNFNSATFKSMTETEYENWIDSWFKPLLKILKPTATVYVCCDWKSSVSIYNVLSKYLIIRNRITWEREKGRGALSNWKNCSEDIWYATFSDDYYFNPDTVKLLRKVLAPYRDENKQAKDWFVANDGTAYRLTYPSNLWTDITIPFWSMPENTPHPTQKPEKLIAKLILASSKKNDFVFDPFLGSGTTAVVAKKLNRKYCGIEINDEYCIYAEKRLKLAEENPSIQGYENGYFLERNTSFEKLKKDKQNAFISKDLFTTGSE
ncbi:MAG: methyltransferase [Bacteroidia bacterium]|nr:MAG: methyltransferase [Bacteroidia bacterium]